jgi:hypothetical protein
MKIGRWFVGNNSVILSHSNELNSDGDDCLPGPLVLLSARLQTGKRVFGYSSDGASSTIAARSFRGRS